MNYRLKAIDTQNKKDNVSKDVGEQNIRNELNKLGSDFRNGKIKR